MYDRKIERQADGAVKGIYNGWFQHLGSKITEYKKRTLDRCRLTHPKRHTAEVLRENKNTENMAKKPTTSIHVRLGHKPHRQYRLCTALAGLRFPSVSCMYQVVFWHNHLLHRRRNPEPPPSPGLVGQQENCGF